MYKIEPEEKAKGLPENILDEDPKDITPAERDSLERKLWYKVHNAFMKIYEKDIDVVLASKTYNDTSVFCDGKYLGDLLIEGLTKQGLSQDDISRIEREQNKVCYLVSKPALIEESYQEKKK
jgi:hypothetical protein